VESERVRLELRLTKDDQARWQTAAARARSSVSELVRERVNAGLARGAPRFMHEMEVVESAWCYWRESFLTALHHGRSVTEACRLAGVSRTLAYRERASSREFAVSWELALAAAEHELDERLHEEESTLSRSFRRAPLPLVAAAARSRRDARLEVRLGRAELEHWRDAATQAGIGLSEFVRRLVEGPGSAAAAAAQRRGSWRVAFIDALRRSGSIATACRAAGVSRVLVYRERQLSPAFASAWQFALEGADDRLNELLLQRGVGMRRVKRSVKRRDGEIVSVTTQVWTQVSDRALIELLRRLKPREWGFSG
jgi:uncharacterized protein (DUF1778 family)